MRTAERTHAARFSARCVFGRSSLCGGFALLSHAASRKVFIWLYPEAPLAHPLDEGAVMLERSLEATCRGLGADASTYRRLIGPFAARWQDLTREFLGPLLHLPRHPLLLARFGVPALPPVTLLSQMFRGEAARALFGGLAAHSVLPLEAAGTSAFALLFAALGHAVGWPFPKGGAQSLADALTAHFCALGGEVHTGVRVRSLRDLPEAKPIRGQGGAF